MGNTVIPGPREKRAAARLQDTMIVTAHLNADAFDAEGRERERRGKECPSPRPAPFQSPCVFARLSELPVRIESAESPVEANCQLLRRSQPGAYCGTELEIPWRGLSLEPSVARDRTIGFALACIYIRTYAGCELYTETRDLPRWVERMVDTR